MKAEDKAREAARMVRGELNHPIFGMAGGAKKAIGAMADALEALAHEVEIMRERAGAHALRLNHLERGAD